MSLNPLCTTEIIILLPNFRVICFLRKYQLKMGNLHTATADPVLVLYAVTYAEEDMAVSGSINNGNRTRQHRIWPPKLAMQQD